MRRGLGAAAVVLAASLALAACGSSNGGSNASSTGSKSTASSKLIIAAIPFQCGLNDFTKSLCQGLAAVQGKMPAGYELQQKFATNFEDTQSFTNLIQTSLQLHPAGLVVFNDGAAAQVPVLKQACAQGVKVILLDNAAKGLGDCESSFIEANNRQLGVNLGKWLLAHAPASKEVAIVTQQPGLYASAGERDKGFEDTVKAAGYSVVATGVTDLTPGKTRELVTNILTAHPKLGAIFSAMDQIGSETAEAIGSKSKIVELSIDGSPEQVVHITQGLVSADAAQAPAWLGSESVMYMTKLLGGQSIPKLIYEPTEVVDATNAKAYLASGGLR